MQTNSQNFVIPSNFVYLSTTMSYVDTELNMIDLSFTGFWDLF